jgi:hypothetical protein
MNKRTITRIVKALLEGKGISTRVQGYFYDVFYDEDLDIVEFSGRGAADGVISTADPSNYSYEMGGSVYRAAQNACWNVDEEFRKHIAAKEKSPDFSDLKYNGQITRYFDEDKSEYDMACANKEIKKETTIYVLTWTKEGYEIVHKY